MFHFCADDYGISKESCDRIETCVKNGVLRKVSVLPNGVIAGFKERFAEMDVELALHVNLVEGIPLSDPKEIPLLVAQDGSFRHSFIGLFFQSLFANRKEFERQVHTELRNQLRFWQEQMGEGTPISIDSHQHAYLIPRVFKILTRVIREEGITVQCMRVAAEPIAPFLRTPSLYLSYRPSGLIKQWLLKLFALINMKEFKKTNAPTPCFMGVMFSGKMSYDRVKKLLPKYLEVAKKRNQMVEIGLHPGYFEAGETPMPGCQKSFEKFYFSPWRHKEYESLLLQQERI